ncbi:MAG: YraN family protein [Robiginitomaculum sp.]
MSKNRKRAELAGRRAETRAALFLQLKAYVILERRYKTKLGEIDLIARRGNVIIFIEVKHRKSLDAGLYAVSPAQTRRIDAAANLYMAQMRGSDSYERRNDIIVIGARALPHHIKDAWR